MQQGEWWLPTVPCVRFYIAEGGATLYRHLCVGFYTAGGGAPLYCLLSSVVYSSERTALYRPLCLDFLSRGAQLSTVPCIWFI